MSEPEIHYEMLWDCAQCNAKGLLGKSHRHCPACGAIQDPTKRYFPKEGEEVEVKNHQFVGADWNCAYCSSPNSAAAAHCTNCGAGQNGSKPVALVADTANSETAPPKPVSAQALTSSAVPPSHPSPPQPPSKRNMGCLLALLASVAIAVIGIFLLFTSTKDTTVTVAGRSWVRGIQIEQMMRVSDSAWCDSLPSDAYSVSRNREQRSTRQVPDGQDCHDERIDKGDGTFVKHRECTPRYRNEPVYDDRCRYQVNRWRSVRSVKASTQNSLVPAWPVLGSLNAPALVGGLGGGAGALGSEREGTRSENYVLTLTADGKTWNCHVSESVWSKYKEGTTTPIKVRLTGGADCDSLK